MHATWLHSALVFLGTLIGLSTGGVLATIWIYVRYTRRGVTWASEDVRCAIEALDNNPAAAVLQLSHARVYCAARGGAFRVTGYPPAALIGRHPEDLGLSEHLLNAYDKAYSGEASVLFHDGDSGLSAGRSYCSSFALTPLGVSIITLDVTGALGVDRLARIEALLVAQQKGGPHA